MVFDVSTRTLTILAALVWYTGAAILLCKGIDLLLEAGALRPSELWPTVAIAVGACAGVLKAILVFNRGGRKILDRIAGLDRPRLWQVFSPGFLVALALMIAAGASLARSNAWPT